jgi:DNA-dependent RNA polymerase
MKNNYVNKDLNNTIVNFNSKFEYNSRLAFNLPASALMLIIYADYSKIGWYITKITKAFIRTKAEKSTKCSSLSQSVSWIRLGGIAVMHGYQPLALSSAPAAHKVGLENRLRGPFFTVIGSGGVLRQHAAVRNYVCKAALLVVDDTSTKVSVAPASEVGTGDELKNSSNGINQIMTEITNNPMYIHISKILNSSVDGGQKVNNRKKQELIEKTLRKFWYKELLSIFKGKKSLFNNSIGINILKNSISKLDYILNRIKMDKRYLKGKSYVNHIRVTDNGVIVSIVLSNIIPHIIKNRNFENTASLFKKIGLELHNNLLNIEWEKYNNTNNYQFDVSWIEGSQSVMDSQIGSPFLQQLEVDHKFIDNVSTTETNDSLLDRIKVNKLTAPSNTEGLSSTPASQAHIGDVFTTDYAGFFPYGSEFEGFTTDDSEFSGLYSEHQLGGDESFAKKEVKKGLSKEEFSIKLDEILGNISSDDYFKLGFDLTEIIASNSNIFKLINIADEDNTVKRVVVADKGLNIEIFRAIAVYTDKLVMIFEPNKWDVTINEDTKSFEFKKYGGLILNEETKNSFITKSHKNTGETKLENSNIIDTINFLSSIAFTINTPVLKHLLFIIKGNYNDDKENGAGCEVSAAIKKLIKLNIHPETKNMYNLSLRKKQGEILDILTHNSQYYSDKSIITSALLFSSWCDSSEENKLYFNYFMDWRGRLYTDTSYLSFQGGELARSLLKFKSGAVLTTEGLEALKAYTANCYGLGKKSYNDRLKWTEDNLDIILSVPDTSFCEAVAEAAEPAEPAYPLLEGGDKEPLMRAIMRECVAVEDIELRSGNPHPLRDIERGHADAASQQCYASAGREESTTVKFYKLMLQAKEPFLFLSCCVELKNYYAEPNDFISSLPIYLDATCSGLQHLSSMINDSNLAKYVNIINSNKDDIPNDVYTYMVSFVNDKIQKLIEKDPSLAILGNIVINREFIKPGIMTISYGSTGRGISDKIKSDHFRQLDLVKGENVKYLLISKQFNKSEFDIHLNNKQLLKLGEAIHSVLFERFPDLTILVKFLKDMNKLLRNIKLPTIWLTPGGIIIEQGYSTSYSRDIPTSILGKRRNIRIMEMNKEEIDIRKQNNAIVPNIVHSFDASNISLLIKIVSSNFDTRKINLLTIHDCFATNANDVEKMRSGVKLGFLAIYSDKSFIDSYYDFIIDFIKKSGYNIIEKTSAKGITKKWVVTPVEEIKIKIPEKPSFTNDNNLNYKILNAQYFIK